MTDPKKPEDARATRYGMHNAPTQPAREAVRLPREEPRTLADLDETIGKRISAMQATVLDDARLREQRITEQIDALKERVDVVESDAKGAKRASGHSLEQSRESAIAIAEMRKLTAQLEKQPNSADAAREIKKATADAGAELAGLITDARALVRKWGPIAAISFGAVAGGSSYLASRGTAKEAASEAVQSAPRTQERVIVVTQPGTPAPTTQETKP